MSWISVFRCFQACYGGSKKCVQTHAQTPKSRRIKVLNWKGGTCVLSGKLEFSCGKIIAVRFNFMISGCHDSRKINDKSVNNIVCAGL